MIRDSLTPAAQLCASPAPLSSQVPSESINCLLCYDLQLNNVQLQPVRTGRGEDERVTARTRWVSYRLLPTDTGTVCLWLVTYADLRKAVFVEVPSGNGFAYLLHAGANPFRSYWRRFFQSVWWILNWTPFCLHRPQIYPLYIHIFTQIRLVTIVYPVL